MEPDISYSYFGIAIMLLLWIKASKHMLVPITVCAATILLVPFSPMYFNITYYVWLSVWLTAAFVLLTCYALRFRRRKSYSLVDYFKLSAVIAFSFYPLSFQARPSLPYLITFYVTAIYAYDRLIITPHKMNKRHLAALVIQSLLIFMFFVYAMVQRTEAIRNAEEVMNQSQQAIHMQAQSEKLRTQLDSCRSAK